MGAIVSPIYGFTAQAFADVVNTPLTTDGAIGGSAFTFVQKFLSPFLGGSGSTVRISLKGHSANSAVITAMYIGSPKTFGTPAYDFAASPTQVLFSGNAGVTIAANQTIDSDDVAFTISGGASLMIATNMAANSRFKYAAGLGSNFISYAASGVSEAASTSKAGTYTSAFGASGRLNFITRVQAK